VHFLEVPLFCGKQKKQKTTSKSSAESEYRSMSTAMAELVWLATLLRDLQVSFQYPVTLACDNTAAQHIADNPVFHNRTKHLDIGCHFVRDHIQSSVLQTVHVHSML